MYSPLEVLGLVVLALAVLWLALGAPGALAGFAAILSPFDALLAASRKASEVSKDQSHSAPTRMLAAAFAKLGVGFVLAICAAMAALLLFAILRRFTPYFLSL